MARKWPTLETRRAPYGTDGTRIFMRPGPSSTISSAAKTGGSSFLQKSNKQTRRSGRLASRITAVSISMKGSWRRRGRGAFRASISSFPTWKCAMRSERAEIYLSMFIY